MLQVQYNQNITYNKDKEAGQQKINVLNPLFEMNTSSLQLIYKISCSSQKQREPSLAIKNSHHLQQHQSPSQSYHQGV